MVSAINPITDSRTILQRKNTFIILTLRTILLLNCRVPAVRESLHIQDRFTHKKNTPHAKTLFIDAFKIEIFPERDIGSVCQF